MNKFAFAIVAAAGLAGTAFAQTTPTTATYEIRLVPAAASGLDSSGGSTDASSVNFVVQARATTAAGTTNYGINRWSSGSITGSAGSTLTRASSSSATAFGRFRPTANAGAQNFARFQAAAGTGGTSASAADANNVNGTVAGNSITGVDAYRGFAWTGLGRVDGDGEPLPGDDQANNPWNGANAGLPGFAGAPTTDGSAGAWQSLYAFNYTAAGFGQQTITLGGALNIASSITFVAGNWTFNQLQNVTFVNTLAGATYTFTVVPTPGAVALLGLGGLAAVRRRR